MATGHILPGFGDPVSRLRRVKSAGYPLDGKRLLNSTLNSRIDYHEFNRIKEEARQIWSRPDREPTTYNFFFQASPTQSASSQTLAVPRPSSPTRLNKPHPPLVFLTNRLHYIEGYQNPDTTVGRECYKVDGSLSPYGYGKRRSIRDKYNASPSTSLVNTFKDKYGLKEYLDPEEAQGAEAWLNLANDDDKEGVFEALQNHREQLLNDEQYQPPVRPRTAYPSLHRWMKQAGPQESETISRIIHNVGPTPVVPFNAFNDSDRILPYHSVRGNRNLMKQQDIAAVKNVKWPRTSKRGDFMIHPGWPPSIPHHYVP